MLEEELIVFINYRKSNYKNTSKLINPLTDKNRINPVAKTEPNKPPKKPKNKALKLLPSEVDSLSRLDTSFTTFKRSVDGLR